MIFGFSGLLSRLSDEITPRADALKAADIKRDDSNKGLLIMTICKKLWIKTLC
jgi:hypothetical protein